MLSGCAEGLGKAQTPNHVTCGQDTASAPSPPAYREPGVLMGEPSPNPSLPCIPHTPRSQNKTPL